jgi:hypothetical protein
MKAAQLPPARNLDGLAFDGTPIHATRAHFLDFIEEFLSLMP